MGTVLADAAVRPQEFEFSGIGIQEHDLIEISIRRNLAANAFRHDPCSRALVFQLNPSGREECFSQLFCLSDHLQTWLYQITEAE